MKGGSIQNPIHALVQLLASLKHSNASVAVQGFYDVVAEISHEDHADMAKYPWDAEAEQASLGVIGFTGEEGFSTLEHRSVLFACVQHNYTVAL